MRKKITASVAAFLLLITVPVQALAAEDNGPARRTAINSQAAAVVKAAVKLNVSLSPEFSRRLKIIKPAPDTAAGRVSKKKPVSRGGFGSFDVQKVIRIAVGLKGTPYRGNGVTPAGFDCSGFTMYVYKAGAGISLPHSSAEQAQYGTAVAKADLEPGDLVFFKTSGSGISHVGIFIGGENFISSTSSSGVKVSSLNDSYWGKRYLGARRLRD